MFAKKGDNTPELQSVSLDSIGETPIALDADKGKQLDLNLSLDKFFEDLEQQVNGAVYDEENEVNLEEEPLEPQVSKQVNDNEPEPDEEEVKDLEKELSKLRKQYNDSSNEARRLYEENKRLAELKEYAPILNAMKQDPTLVNTVIDHLEGRSTPKSITDELDLPEDFIFDADEATRNPNSDSARVLDSIVSKKVQRELQGYTQRENAMREKQTAERTQAEQLERFKEKMKMSEEDYSEFREFAESRPLTLEDIWYLKNREIREKAIARKAIEEKEKQLSKMSQTPKSMASVGAHSEPLNEDAEIFRIIQGAAANTDIFGGEIKED